MNVWQSGCDGVFLFNNSGLRDMKVNIEQNWFTKETATFQEGLKATVRRKEFVNTLSKTYFASVRGIGAVAGRALPHDRYIKIPTLNHDAPIEAEKNGRAEVPLTISDDLQTYRLIG